MKVLFISSGNSKVGISPIIKNQGESIIKQGVDLRFFTIKGKGIKGYIKNIKPLNHFLKENDFDVVHAHYSLSAFVASLAAAKPLVVSLMGDDVNSQKYFKVIIRIFNFLSWSKIIVKSKDMKASLGIQNVDVIPNGVDFSSFRAIDKRDCQLQLKWDSNKQHILFAANPDRFDKNYKMVEQAFAIINNSNIEIHCLKNIPNKDVPIYHNAADVVILTSFSEGSPNVIKEAMACNRPIVATDVGDIKEVIGKTDGCFITSFNVDDIVRNIGFALSFGKATTGRNDIKHLESGIVAKKIMSIYNKIIKQ